MAQAKKPDLLEAIQVEQQSIQIGGKCSFGEYLRRASKDDRETCLNALGQYTATAISGALRKRGVDVKSQSIQRHRRGACNCPDDLR